MVLGIFLACGLAFLISAGITFAMIRIAPRLGFVDKPGVRKIHHKPKPLGGGVAIFWGFAIPLAIVLVWVHFASPPSWLGTVTGLSAEDVSAFWGGVRSQSHVAWLLLCSALLVHVMGLYDDLHAMGPFVKLGVQIGAATLLVWGGDVRALHALDALGLGPAPSIILSVLWIVAITNAFNFLDNMDGLSAGVACVCAVAFMASALSIEQWFVAGALALVLGSALGFLLFNFPPSKIFQGDAGSLVLGLLLGALTVRTTYLPPSQAFEYAWYSVLAPVVVLAVPLYDLLVVSTIRVSRGRSPFVGDTNHLSHRLVARGMSRRTAVLCIYLMTGATSASAIVLPHVRSDVAWLLFVQLLLVLGLVMLLEQHPLPPGDEG